MQLLAFHQDYANRLPEQTQRRVYGGAARAPRRHGGGSIMKNFHWEGEPQRELDTATITSLRIFQLIIRTMASTSVAPPSSRTVDNTVLHTVLYSTAPHARQLNEPYTPWEICNEPLIPYSTRIAWTYRAVFCSPLYLNPPAAEDRE